MELYRNANQSLHPSEIKVKLMRRLTFIACSFLLLLFVSCQENEVKEKGAGEYLLPAITALQHNDFDTYLSYTDMVDDLDSVQYNLLFTLFCQHQDKQLAERGSVTKVRIVDTKYQCDSVATVFYKLIYSNKTEEISSQKMVKDGDTWKIRIRN